MRRPSCLAVMSLCSTVLQTFPDRTASAQSNGPATSTGTSGTMAGHAVAVPSATAVRRATPIVLDGRLDDAA